jgi:hypothetical protein
LMDRQHLSRCSLILGIFEQPPEKVKQEFLSLHFFGYFRLLPYDFLFKKANNFIDIDYVLLPMKFKSTE